VLPDDRSFRFTFSEDIFQDTDVLGGITQYVYDTNANVILEHQGDKKAFYAYEHNGLKRFIGYEGMHFTLIRDRSGNINRIIQGEHYYGV
jgi:hypothetical protein